MCTKRAPRSAWRGLSPSEWGLASEGRFWARCCSGRGEKPIDRLFRKKITQTQSPAKITQSAHHQRFFQILTFLSFFGIFTILGKTMIFGISGSRLVTTEIHYFWDIHESSYFCWFWTISDLFAKGWWATHLEMLAHCKLYRGPYVPGKSSNISGITLSRDFPS